MTVVPAKVKQKPVAIDGSIGAPIILGWCSFHYQHMRVSLCYELISSADRNKKEREKQANGTWE
jgi:hypothetical protein